MFDALAGRPHHPVGPDGRMRLSDHLRELRARILRSLLVWSVVFVATLFLYDDLLELVARPYLAARRDLGGEVQTDLVLTGIATGLTLQLKLGGVAAVMLSSPYWLLQIWGFLMPGLHAHERRWTYVFTAVAGPLFLAGVALGYYVLPQGIRVLIGFTPAEATSLVDFGDFFSFVVRMLLVFGVAFQIPVFIVLLNLAGVLRGRTLGRHRPWIVLGTVVFAAVATPSTDPFSMLMLAVPLLVLFLVAEVVTRLLDRARGSGITPPP